jgi:hypothetical protein
LSPPQLSIENVKVLATHLLNDVAALQKAATGADLEKRAFEYASYVTEKGAEWP